MIAVIDPEMMSSMPKGLTAATGMDALTHAMEAVVANGAIDVTDATALYAIKTDFLNIFQEQWKMDRILKPENRCAMHVS